MMEKRLFTLTLLALLSACGGDSNSDNNNNAMPTAHCSESTKIEANAAVILTGYDLKINTCNQLIEIDLIHEDRVDSYGTLVYRSGYEVPGYSRFRSVGYKPEGHTTLVTIPAIDGTPSYNIEYSVNYSDDFITKYNEYSTNTDVIYSTEDEYKLILDYSHPEFVLLDFNEATKDMKEENLTYR